MPEHTRVRLGMHGLLTDESLHVQPQLVILDQWQRVLERPDDELLARRQQQVQDVAEMGGERLVGHVVERQLRPIELDVTRLQNDPLVIERRRRADPLPGHRL